MRYISYSILCAILYTLYIAMAMATGSGKATYSQAKQRQSAKQRTVVRQAKDSQASKGPSVRQSKGQSGKAKDSQAKQRTVVRQSRTVRQAKNRGQAFILLPYSMIMLFYYYTILLYYYIIIFL